MKKVPSVICLLILLNQHAYTQYYNTGQDPASLRWRQIKTDHYKLIFPEHFEKKAQYLANIMDFVSRNETHSLHARVPRIPVLLHTQSATSNGITVWAPKRIELYPCTPQQTYAEEWLEQLAIHEYRHALQISKINNGFSKALYYIFGEQITGGILGLYVPSWFLEGDATVTETALSKTGRGRSSLFESTLRAQIIEKGPYPFDLATLGSYKTFTPDAYSLGYFLVGQARKHYGDMVWDEALDRVAKFPFMVIPFNSGIRKSTGLWKKQLYKQSLTELDSVWKKQLRETHHTEFRPITRRDPKNFVVYNHPLVLNDSSIVADKSSMDDIDRFVLINRWTGSEKILLTPGFHISGTTSIGGNYLVWSEYEPDLRWGNRDFAEIRIYDFRTKKIREMTTKSRYFAPVISPDGRRVAAVFVSPGNQNSIDILEVPSGKLIRRYPIPHYGAAITPNWSPDAKGIIFILLTEKGETISVLDTATGKFKNIIPYFYQEFNGHAYFYKQYIIYSVDYSGAENLYAMDTLTHAIYKITSGRFASLDPDFTPDKRFMIYSDYNSDGTMVVENEIDTSKWIPVRQVVDHSIKLYNDLAVQEKCNIQDSILVHRIYKMNQSDNYNLTDDSIQGIIYPVKKYAKAANLFNPHSWAPVSFNINNQTFRPGVMVLSQNTLSTMFANAGWEHDLNEQTGKLFAGLSYRGLYPVIDVRFDIGNRAGWVLYEGSHESQRFTWQETNFKTDISIPWNFSHSKYSRFLQPKIGTTLIGIQHHSSTPEQFTKGMIQSMDYRLTAYQYLRSNQKDVYPHIGQSIDVNFRNTPFGGNNIGSIFAAVINLYFPGIIRHQGLWISGGYQHRQDFSDLSYSFSNIVAYPRGYTGAYDQALLSTGVNYKFPLLYPDLSVGSVLYVKRLKMNLYYDWANGMNTGYINTYQSLGGELTADFHLLRFVGPIEMGIRSLYYPGDGSWGFEFLYSISAP
ncbi:MAG: hypothetical protein M0Q38_14775 [Bacteroidales bacterium]|jgi:hypothetical protein|nr:hypothetical protein [Bacteroidales bacterium]